MTTPARASWCGGRWSGNHPQAAPIHRGESEAPRFLRFPDPAPPVGQSPCSSRAEPVHLPPLASDRSVVSARPRRPAPHRSRRARYPAISRWHDTARACRLPHLPEKRGEKVCHRSEEHTSELQSLMRISYAVFCLKKKKINNNKKEQDNAILK